MAKLVISHSFVDSAMDYLRDKIDQVVVTNGGSPEELLPELRDADAAIVRIGSITGAMLEECPNLKVIGRSGVGYDDIDVVAATKKGIPVTITPGGNARAVAEHTFSLMLAAAKNLVRMDVATREGNFGIRNERSCVELFGKELYLIGFGYIGKLVAGYATAFGMSVAVYDPFISPEAVTDLGYKYVKDLSEGVKTADFISLHVPLTKETKDLFSTEYFSLMKKKSILINCARGGIVNEDALKEALDSEQIYAAGLDVFSAEPPSKDMAIFQAQNLTVSPHNASLTEEAVVSVQQMCAESIVSVLDGNVWEKVADKEVYKHPRWKS